MSAMVRTPQVNLPSNAEGLPEVIWMGDWPLLYEDDFEGEMGENNQHVCTDEILHIGIQAHLADRPSLRTFSNMNLYYPRRLPMLIKPPPYLSPDIMVVEPFQPLGEAVSSYHIDVDGPEPLTVLEILSERSAQQRDLQEKPHVLAKLNIREFLLVDPSGDFLPGRLLLKKLQADGMWADQVDADGGVTSHLGFRLVIDKDERVRVTNASTGEPYPRPDEAAKLQKQLQQLQAENAWLKVRLNPPGC